MTQRFYNVIVIGGGHAGAEAAWAAANLLGCDAHRPSVALVTLDPSKIGVMPCNPAIGGLAKGQIVREIDAMGGLMGLAADATGINFKVLNTSRGPAVRGPRCQCDKHAYAETVHRMLASRGEIDIIAASVERFRIERGRVTGVVLSRADPSETFTLACESAVLTTGTFMRGLMHTGPKRTPGGRHGEATAVGISATLEQLGFELGRLKTGTPPRLTRSTINWDALDAHPGDVNPQPFSDLTPRPGDRQGGWVVGDVALERFPRLDQVECRVTATNERIHDIVRNNLHRAPMYSGQIQSVGPRYCPSIEDKVVRFADRTSHSVFLEPESLRDDSIYCNGISTSLPGDVQDEIVRLMPGCERAHIRRYGYAVEYDMVRPHQIRATCETKLIEGLFLAGQINGTSGYEEAAGQGLVAGINAARRARGEGEFTLGRDQAYIGVLMDDLVTKTPVEPYRMFTSRAEHRLILRADNAADRLTPLAIDLGLLESTALGRRRADLFARRRGDIAAINDAVDATRIDGTPLSKLLRRPEFGEADLRAALSDRRVLDGVWTTVHADRRYQPYIARHRADTRRLHETESRRIPREVDYHALEGLRSEAAEALTRFRPDTFGQAGRLEGVTPADLTLLSVHLKRLAREPRRSPVRTA
ncbi:MAG: tRNA uridine-5-carboxymethylaminomethyl(34) synthesis enzyme MnmG [Planctomycetes bacterium]|nr:tRNA uridine-5-carboxymethylaminomethyl(34) synthesis enzyme MnmG [Planctomycetota bacterium]